MKLNSANVNVELVSNPVLNPGLNSKFFQSLVGPLNEHGTWDGVDRENYQHELIDILLDTANEVASRGNYPKTPTRVSFSKLSLAEALVADYVHPTDLRGMDILEILDKSRTLKGSDFRVHTYIGHSDDYVIYIANLVTNALLIIEPVYR